MKHCFLLPASLVLVACLACSCGEKKPSSTDIITIDYEVSVPQDPIKMEATHAQSVAEWVEGRIYYIDVNREPSDSLPMVSNSAGQQFFDNVVRIAVKRQDGTTFYHHDFTKAAFATWLDDDYRQNALLEDITFIKVEADRLLFTAIVNHPQSADDVRIYLQLTIDRMGKPTIQQYDDDMREDLQMNGDQSASE